MMDDKKLCNKGSMHGNGQFALVMSRLPGNIYRCSCKYMGWVYLMAEICELFLTFLGISICAPRIVSVQWQSWL